MGRPSKYTRELADLICERIVKGGSKGSLRKVCEADDMPDAATVNRWLSKDEEFRKQYARACSDRADAIVDEAYEIIDDGSSDEYELDDGSQRTDHNHIQRARAQMQLRQWHAARLSPKKYGEFQRTEVTGADGGPIQKQEVRAVDAPPQETREEWEARKQKELEARNAAH